MLFLWNFLLERKRFSSLILLAIIVFGAFSLITIPKESAPEVEVPIGIVTTPFPGASAEEVETLVTNKVERRVANLDNITNLTSTSEESLSSVVVEFDASADIDKSMRELRDAVDGVKSDLPDEANDPNVSQVDLVNQPIVTVLVIADVLPEELILLGNEIETELERVPGVSNVSVGGSRDKEVTLVVDQEALQTYGLTLSDVTQGIHSANASLPAGSIVIDDVLYAIRFEGELTQNEKYGDIPIVTKTGTVYLRDLGRVVDGLTKRTSISRGSVDGQPSLPALSFSVFKQSGSDVTEVAKRVRDRVSELKDTEVLEGLETKILYDIGELVNDDLTTLGTSGLQTITLVAILLFAALGWREAILAGSAIPLSFLAGFIGLLASGNTLNFVSLFALILAVGILVDSAIVITEGIHRNLKNDPEGDKQHATKNALKVFHWPITSGTMTTIAVFAPLFLVSGIVGEFIASIPFTIIFVLLASLFVALGMVPMIATKFLKRRTTSRLELKQEALTHKLQGWYRGVLERIIGHKKYENRFLVGLVLLFVITLSFPFLGFVKVIFFPEGDSDYIFVDVELPVSSELTQTDVEIRRIEEILYQYPEIDSFVSVSGEANPFANGGVQTSGDSERLGNIQITLKDKRSRSSIEIMNALREDFKLIGTADIRMFQDSGGPPVGDPIVITLKGDNLGDLSRAAETVFAVLTSIPGTSDVKTTARESAPEIVFTVDRDRVAEVGVTPVQLASTLRTAISGFTATEIVGTDNDADFVVKVALNPHYRNEHDTNRANIDILRNLSVGTPSGPVLLGSLVDVSIEEGKTAIRHDDQERIMTVSSGVLDGANALEIVTSFNKKSGSLDLPEGVTLTVGGENEDTDQSFRDMGVSLIIGLIAMIAILVLQFNSYRHALFVISIVPFSLIGIMIGLALTQNALSFPSIMGFIALTGIVVNNSIILIDVINNSRKTSSSVREAVIEGAVSRIRPILLTTITTVVGVTPLIFASSLWAPLAYAIMFGLSFSIFITLLLVPIIYNRWPGH